MTLASQKGKKGILSPHEAGFLCVMPFFKIDLFYSAVSLPSEKRKGNFNS